MELKSDLLLSTSNMLRDAPSEALCKLDALCRKAVLVEKLDDANELGLSRTLSLFGMAVLDESERESLNAKGIEIVSMQRAIELVNGK